MPRPKKVNNAADELAETLTITLEVSKSKGGNGKKAPAKSTGKNTLMTITVPKGKTPKDKNVVVNQDAKEIVDFVKDVQSTFLGGHGDKTKKNKKRSVEFEDSDTDSESTSSCKSCSCTDCEDSSFTSSSSSDSSSGCSTRSSSSSYSSREANPKKAVVKDETLPL